MKAAVIHQFGDPDVLKYEDFPTPKPRPGHILIKVVAAGEVAELGKGVNSFTIGERVIPMPGFPLKEEEYHIRPAATAPSFTLPGLGIPGTYAQYIEIPAQWVLKDDTGLKPEEVATLPVPLATGVRAVKEVGGVKAGDKVLIHSGASGSGSMQIQVAKALGAQVATTVRNEANIEFTKKVGADLVVNTRKEDFVGRVKAWTSGLGVDVVIDNLGGDVLPKSIDAARPLGVVVVFGFVAGTETTLNIPNFYFPQKQLRGAMASDIENLTWGLEQVRAGRIKPLLDRALPLSQAAEAHRLVANNKVKGNLVMLPWAE